jgi:hypothetical protein
MYIDTGKFNCALNFQMLGISLWIQITTKTQQSFCNTEKHVQVQCSVHPVHYYYYYYYYYYLIELKWGFTRWQWYYNKTQHKNTHARRATQTIKDTLNTMNTTQKVKLRLQQAMEACGVVRCRGSHIVQTVGSQMAVRLSTLHASSALPPEIFWYSFLLQAN